MTSMVDTISSIAMDTPIAVILVELFGGTISFFRLSVMKLLVILIGLVIEFDAVNCVATGDTLMSFREWYYCVIILDLMSCLF